MKIPESKYNEIFTLYFEQGLSQSAISQLYNTSQNTIFHILKKNGKKSRTSHVNNINNQNHLSLNKWRSGGGKNWNTGLTAKTSDIIRIMSEKARQTQIKNGKTRGSNNAMWGKTTQHKNGMRVDLGHRVRSGWEANFARILNYLKLPYEYEKHNFKLSNGSTYTPDFYIPSKKIYYELKGYEYRSVKKHELLKIEYPFIKLHVLKEREYARLIKFFSSKVNFEDNMVVYTNDQLSGMYKNRISQLEDISVRAFCIASNISYKFIARRFGSMKAFQLQHIDFIKEVYLDMLKQNLLAYKEIHGLYPTVLKQFQKFYKQAKTYTLFVFGNSKMSNLRPYTI